MNKDLEQLVDRVSAEFDASRMDFFEMKRLLEPHISHRTIDDVYARLGVRAKAIFLSHYRLQLYAFDALIRDAAAEGRDPNMWRAIRHWVARQPFPAPEDLPLGEILAQRADAVKALADLLPHLSRHSVEEVLSLDPRRREGLRSVASSIRAELDTFVATARAHGQDPTPLLRFAEWAEAEEPGVTGPAR